MSINFQQKEKNTNQTQQKQILEELTTDEFVEEKYRWVIVALMAACLLINGFANSAIIPIANKVQIVYELSSAYVNAPITASFLVYSFSNFPANYIIDKHGLRVSFLIGSGMYALGLLLFALINKGYHFVLIGSILVALGQPFIVNCPAKVATFWFLNKNRTFATGLMIGSNLLSIGISFMLPTLAVGQDSYGTKAKDQIFYLYAVYFFIAAFVFIMVFIFMRAKPKQAPSLGAQAQKSTFKQSIQILKKDKNLWVFFSAYILTYGTVIALGSIANLLFKPYGFSDVQIGLCAIVMLIMGVLGSIAFSVYIKKTNNYKRAIRSIVAFSLIAMSFLFVWLNISAGIAMTLILIGIMGFVCTPVIAICYDLGCQLAFPMGQAQVTGLLNGGSLFFTFITSLIISAAVGFGQKTQSLVVMIIFIVFLIFGSILFFKVKVHLKRRNLESGKLSQLQPSKVAQLAQYHHEHHHHTHDNGQSHAGKQQIQLTDSSTKQESDSPTKVFNDQKRVQINKQKYVAFEDQVIL